MIVKDDHGSVDPVAAASTAELEPAACKHQKAKRTTLRPEQTKPLPKAIAYLPPTRTAPKSAPKFKLAGGLSDRQKAAICAEATKAAAVRGIHGAKAVEAWRRAEQFRRFRIASLCDALASDYPRLRAHFQMLARNAGKAFDTEMRAQTNGQRQYRWVLEKACKEAGLELSYAAAICKTQYKCDMDDATETQLKQLLYTVRNRAASKAKAPEPDPDQGAEDNGDPF